MIMGMKSFCFAQIDYEKCPAPTKRDFANVCLSIYQRLDARSPESKLGYAYQEELWSMSCARQKDTVSEATEKIQNMWNKNRETFRCYNYPTSIASDRNVTKFSLDTGFTAFLIEAVRKYKLDMNFVDPADKLTILDFIEEREKYIRNLQPVDTPKADEYKKIYNLLKLNGAKHSWELNK